MSKFALLKIASAAVLASAALAAQAAGPDWSLIISGPGIVVPPPPVQVAPVRVTPVVVAPPPPPVVVAPVQATAIQGVRQPDTSWEWNRDRERERAERDRYFQERFNERFQERENYYLERERAFIAREKAFLEREKQRQLVVENNTKASSAINVRQDQQLELIVQGVSTNVIDKNEFITLMAQQKTIRDREASFLADGFMSQEEYQALTVDLNNAEQAIRVASRPDRPRYGDRREGDRSEGDRMFFPMPLNR
jgi:hypothetical protein